MNVGLAAAPVQSWAVAVAVPGPDFGETLPSLVLGSLQWKSQPASLAWDLSPGWRDGALTVLILAMLACLFGCSVVSEWRKLS